jgi:hypothetical protein
MLKHLKDYWIIWLINVGAVITFLTVFGMRDHMLQFILCESGFIWFLFTYSRDEDASINDVLSAHNDIVRINGVFKEVILNKGEIKNISVERNFVSRVFDWSKVKIATNASDVIVYTKRIKLPIDLHFLQ